MPSELCTAVSAIQSPRDDLEAIFRAHYARIAGIVARVTHDRARAEDLAVEVFLKWRKQSGKITNIEAWLHRTAVRTSLDELRRQQRRRRYEDMTAFLSHRRQPTPEELYSASQDHTRVRAVLLAIGARNAEMLLLRSQGSTYAEVASILGLNPSSIGALISRAQQAFKKEYLKRYGTTE